MPRVLIVDDEEIVLRSLSRPLARAGYEVVARGSLPEAAAVLAAEPIDVVLTDLRVGRASGLDLVAAARALPRPPGIIVCSGLAGTEDIAAALAAGATAVVKKPVVPSDLVAAVAAAVPRTP